MAKPFVIPTVTTSRMPGFSLDEMQKRLAQGANVVRVGLPDSTTTERGEAIRKTRVQRKGKQK